jgi:hypothetical protein
MLSTLDIPAGIITDETLTTVGQAAWADGSYVRFWKGRPQARGGFERLVAENVTGVCRTVYPWTDNIGALVIGFGTHTKLQVWRGGALYDITPTGLAAGAEHGTGTAGFGTGAYSVGGYSEPSTTDYFPRTWALDAYGESLMANPRGGTIFWWQNNTATPAAALTNAPANVAFMLVNEQRQVMAFGCNQEVGGAYNPLCIRFSDLEDPTDWTTTSSNNAGEIILKGGGRIIGARRLGPYILVWTDNALYLGTFIGDPSQTWRFDLVASNCGLMGPNAVVVVNQTAYWPSPAGQFYTGGPAGVLPLPCTVRNEFIDNLTPSQLDKVVASSCGQFSEIRFDYPDARDGFENSRFVTMNTIDGAWSRGIEARSAYVDAGPSVSPIGVSPAGDVYFHERGKTADGGALSSFIESADTYIDGDCRQMRINEVQPDFEDQVGALTMTVKTRSFAQGEVDEWDPITLAPGETFQDFRAEGRFVRVRLEASSVPSSWRLGRLMFDVTETGRR